jgi:hypothetical protein
MIILDDIFSACAQPLAREFTHVISGKLGVEPSAHFGDPATANFYRQQCSCGVHAINTYSVGRGRHQIAFDMDLSETDNLGWGSAVQVTVRQSLCLPLVGKPHIEYFGVFAFPDAALAFTLICRLVAIPASVPPPPGVWGYADYTSVWMTGLAAGTRLRFA